MNQFKDLAVGTLFLIYTVATSTVLVLGQNCSATLPTLPDEIESAKAKIISLSLNNIDRWGDPEIQALINEQSNILENWFVQNRPDNEVELTIGPWFNAWFEDTSLFADNFFKKEDRNNSYQVIRDGFYYNVAKVNYGILFQRPRTLYLKGDYTIKDPKTESSCGEKRRNVIDLEFTKISSKQGFIPSDSKLTDFIDALDRGDIRNGISFNFVAKQFPTADLWNLYIDKDLRVCFGANDGGNDPGSMFVLLRQEFING
jgi:hypothetical protein